jgi:hypothetical protein
MEMASVLIFAIGGLLILGGIAWIIKFLLQPMVIILLFAALGWGMWFAAFGIEGSEGPSEQGIRGEVEQLQTK